MIHTPYLRPQWASIGLISLLCLSAFAPLTNALGSTQHLWVEHTVSPLNPSPRTIRYVGGHGPHNYTKIQDAINNASSGDVIFVYKGIYHEHVALNKKVTLLGEIREQTIIDGSNTGNVIKITVNGTTVQQFTLRNAGVGMGISVVRSSNTTIHHNSITANWGGIGFSYCSYNIVSDNIIINNNFEGINPVHTTFSVFQDNVITNNLKGISLSESTGNTIVGNIFRGNSRGVDIEQSSNTNKLFHNSFFTSQDVNGYDACRNTWDNGYPSGGNYWDDYTGRDNNHDGIGDTPYNIPGGGGNRDLYPLMKPWNHPPYQPAEPIPPDDAVNIPLNVAVSVFVYDPDGNTMNVSFYNAVNSQLIGVARNVASSTRASISWNGLQNMTQYSWYAVANDSKKTNRSDTWTFTTGNGSSYSPEPPSIHGPTSGTAGTMYNYTFATTDPQGDDVFYYIEWGDSTNSGWIGPYHSAEEIILSHTWEKRGFYTIRAKAKDIYGQESQWGTLKVTMPAVLFNTATLLQKFDLLLDLYPRLPLLLRLLFGLQGSINPN